MSTMYCIPFSPWSLRALRVLEHHGIPVSKQRYTPFVSERAVRKQMGKTRGMLTVPVWFVDEKVFDDSWDIAKRAEQGSSAPPLFPAELLEEMQSANALSEAILQPSRALSILRVLQTPAALRESLPKSLAKLPVVSNLLGTLFLTKFARKYGIRREKSEEYEGALRSALEQLRTQVAAADHEGRITLYPQFTYADIALGLSLQLLQPLPATRIGKENRKAMTDEGLITEYADLFAWRDQLHEKFRLLPNR